MSRLRALWKTACNGGADRLGEVGLDNSWLHSHMRRKSHAAIRCLSKADWAGQAALTWCLQQDGIWTVSACMAQELQQRQRAAGVLAWPEPGLSRGLRHGLTYQLMGAAVHDPPSNPDNRWTLSVLHLSLLSWHLTFDSKFFW